ncbi:adenosylcobinamide-GDP ribazoletransferase [Lentibacillus juripiscarius]|uniref:Adenosylcobinamide-GDP ribazoletransferase n=1 Tax=Lentibacillus juripiscarius TaxID=257446 RepID=A0ABW5V8N7_9BACI
MRARLTGILIGVCINLQFFTSIPMKRELPINRFYLSYALRTFPLLGFVQGAIYAFVLYVLQSYTPFSDMILAFGLWLLLILLSGGIHLDGLMDTSDAYFSYKDVDKRLEIMKDPRAGAFGVLAITVFLTGRFVIFYELVRLAGEGIYVLVMLVPLLGKMLMGAYLQLVPSARKDGMAYLFQQGAGRFYWIVYGGYLLVMGIGITFLNIDLLVPYMTLMLVMAAGGYILSGKIKKHFGGITGDTLGAISEGMELVLWITVWLFYVFALV